MWFDFILSSVTQLCIVSANSYIKRSARTLRSLDFSPSRDQHIGQSILSTHLCPLPWVRRHPMPCPSVQCLSRQCLCRSWSTSVSFFPAGTQWSVCFALLESSMHALNVKNLKPTLDLTLSLKCESRRKQSDGDVDGDAIATTEAHVHMEI